MHGCDCGNMMQHTLQLQQCHSHVHFQIFFNSRISLIKTQQCLHIFFHKQEQTQSTATSVMDGS